MEATHCEIISWPTFARPYFTFWRVHPNTDKQKAFSGQDETKVWAYSDIPNAPASELGIDYEAAKKDQARFLSDKANKRRGKK
jgi:hypothetical protein